MLLLTTTASMMHFTSRSYLVAGPANLRRVLLFPLLQFVIAIVIVLGLVLVPVLLAACVRWNSTQTIHALGPMPATG
jgi:hypothetical protein